MVSGPVLLAEVRIAVSTIPMVTMGDSATAVMRSSCVARLDVGRQLPGGCARWPGLRVMDTMVAPDPTVQKLDARQITNVKESQLILEFAILSVALLGQNGAITERARPLVESENASEKDPATALVPAAVMTLKSATVATASVLTGPNGQRGLIAQNPAEKA